MSQTMSAGPLPSAMEEKLAQIRQRQAGLAVLRAVAVGMAVLLVTMVLAMLIDWQWTLFSTNFRTTLTVTSVLLSVAAALMAGLPALVAALQRIQAAANADEAIPQLEERWQTVVAAAKAGHPASTTAKAMLQQVTSEAVAIGRVVQPRRVADAASLKSSLKALAACAVVMAGFLAIDWPQTSVLLRRFFAPTTPITATTLVIPTGDVVIARGEFVSLVAQMQGLRRKSAVLTIDRADSKPETVTLTVDKKEADRFVHRLQAEESFQYRVRAGDGQTDWQTVTVVDYPTLAEVRFTIIAPAYLQRPNVEKTIIPGRLKVMQGSLLQLQMRPKDPLQRLELTITPEVASDEQSSAKVQQTALTADDDGWYRFQLPLNENLSLTPQLWNAHGLTNENPTVCRIQVIADQAPVARVLTPTEEMSVATDDVVDIKFEAHDDHGITKAELVVYDESAAVEGQPTPVLKVLPIPLGDQQLAKHIVGTTQLDLKQLNLKPGTQVSYAVRVTDNRMVSDERTMPSPRETSAESTDGDSEKTPPSSDSIADASSKPNTDGASDKSDKTSSSAAADQPGEDTAKDLAQAVAPTTDSAIGPDQKAARVAASNPVASDEPAHSDDKPAKNSASDTTKERAATQSESPKPGNDSAAAHPMTEVVDDDGKPKSPMPTASAGEPRKAGPPPDTTDAKTDRNPAAEKSADNADASKSKDAENTPTRKLTEPAKSTEGQPANDQNSPSNPPEDGPPLSRMLAMAPQQSESGQNAETKRRLLKITERLSALAAARESQQAEISNVRDRVVEIDGMLATVETGLTQIVNREIPDDEQSARYKQMDTQLGAVENKISALRKETRDEQFAFVGLQMLDIGRSHVTPAREKVFVAIREPVSAASGTSRGALQQIVRARELLAALLKRYDRVARDQQLAEALKDGVKMYEVYVEKMQQLMREARQNQNPLDRKMAVIEVDQEYLDRYAEVLTMRREMMAEFGRILGDDPRLLARYLDLIKRRRASLRDQLSELSRQQKELFTEFSGWQAADAAQREDLWNLAVELRMQTSTQLAKDAAELSERIEKQFPLVLEASHQTPAKVIALGREIAETARGISLEARRQIRQRDVTSDLRPKARQLTQLFVELDATLEQLNFENAAEAEVTTYVTGRLLESRTVADQADLWRQSTEHVHQQRYHGLVEIDQHRITIPTELLRVELLGIEDELSAQFQQLAETSIPEPIVEQIRQLQQLMADMTFEQTSAEFALTENRLSSAEKLLARASENFAQAEALFDRLRRAIAAALDEVTVPNPTVADLEDPQLDEFLTQLEREPNIDAQLGIPERPRNLRVIADSLIWQQDGSGQLGTMEEDARVRIKKEQREQMDPSNVGDSEESAETPSEEALTDEERREQEQFRKLSAELAKAIEAYQERAQDPATDPEELKDLEQAAKELQVELDQQQQAMDPDKLWKPMKADLEKTLAMLKDPKNDPPSDSVDPQKIELLTKDLQRLLDQIRKDSSADNRWKMVAEFERKKEILKAMARGERIPDEQWNKLLSKLDDGLWQVGGRSLPEEYRKAIEQYQEQIRKLTSSGRETDR